MRQFPKTQLRTLQFDSFFIENVKKVQDTKRMNLLPEEAYWLYHSENKLHEFVRRATLDCKIAILAKLDIHYVITVFDEHEGADLPKWMEIFQAAKGLESAKEYFDNYVHYSHSFVIGSLEVHRILNRLNVMHHSKFTPISRYIKRLRDLRKLGSYETLLKEGDFIYFLLKVCIAYTRIAAGDNSLGLDRKELAILVLMYLEHRPMNSEEIKPILDLITPSYKTTAALEKLRKQGLIEKTNHPYNRGKIIKKYTYLITEEGQSKVALVCSKILSYL